FIYMKKASAVDDLSQVLISWPRKIETGAKEKLKSYRLANADKTDGLVLQCYNMLLIVKNGDGVK
ncbi:unnamed protein product, partial [marine sediment metagenome]